MDRELVNRITYRECHQLSVRVSSHFGSTDNPGPAYIHLQQNLTLTRSLLLVLVAPVSTLHAPLQVHTSTLGSTRSNRSHPSLGHNHRRRSKATRIQAFLRFSSLWPGQLACHPTKHQHQHQHRHLHLMEGEAHGFSWTHAHAFRMSHRDACPACCEKRRLHQGTRLHSAFTTLRTALFCTGSLKLNHECRIPGPAPSLVTLSESRIMNHESRMWREKLAKGQLTTKRRFWRVGVAYFHDAPVRRNSAQEPHPAKNSRLLTGCVPDNDPIATVTVSIILSCMRRFVSITRPPKIAIGNPSAL